MLRIVRLNRALSQVSTYFSIYIALLQTALEGCHRPEELFQATGNVGQDLQTSTVLTKGSYKGIIEGHTEVLHRSQRAMP